MCRPVSDAIRQLFLMTSGLRCANSPYKKFVNYYL